MKLSLSVRRFGTEFTLPSENKLKILTNNQRVRVLYSKLVLFTVLYYYLLLLDPLIGPLSLAKVFFSYPIPGICTEAEFKNAQFRSGFRA
jgi:hypothetical protein